MKRLVVLVIICLSLVSLLAGFSGCAPAAAPPKPTATTPAPSAPAPAPPTVQPAPSPTPAIPAAAAPKYGGTLRFPITVYPAGYDPHRKLSYAPFVTLAVFNNLVRYDPAKVQNTPDTIISDLAEKWTVSPSGTEWTFNLVKGVKWHDGKPFTADDVVFTFEKMKDKARSAVADYWSIVTTAAKTDDYTVKITLANASPSLLVQLTSPYAAVVSKHNDTVDFRTPQYLVGTGPYKYKASSSGVSVELVKNPEFFRKDKDGRALPYLDGIVMYAMADKGAQMDAMAAKRIDMINPMGFTVGTQEEEDRYRKTSPGASVETRPTKVGNIMWMNTRYEPLKDVRVRRAIGLIAERPQLIVAAYADKKWGGTDNAFFTPYWGLTPDEIKKITGWGQTYEQRVAEAKKLMADAGYASGFKLKMPNVNMPTLERINVTLADLLRRHLNIEPEVQSLILTEALKLRDSGNYHLFNYASLSVLGEPDELMPLFKSGSPSNYTGYVNADLDKLWDQQSKEMDLAKRRQLTQQIERIMLTDLPAMPVQFNNYTVGWWPYVKGFVVHEASYTSNLAFEIVWFDN